jgi:hypothetical protein
MMPSSTIVVPPLADRALRQRHQRQRAALAIVVGAQEDDDVFQRHHHDQRPQDQRQHAEHSFRRRSGRAPARRHHRFAQRVERAGAYVAVDDADAAEHQGPEGSRGMRFAMPISRGRFRRGDRKLD